MGYTHYWTQTRDFTRDYWVQIREDFEALLKDVQPVQGIPLANGNGELGTSPEVTDQKIWFNGTGDDSHETFCLYRVRPPKETVAVQSRRRLLQDGPEALRPGRHSGTLLPRHRHRSDIPQRELGRARVRLPRRIGRGPACAPALRQYPRHPNGDPAARPLVHALGELLRIQRLRRQILRRRERLRRAHQDRRLVLPRRISRSRSSWTRPRRSSSRAG
jgi:hypothetical protein